MGNLPLSRTITLAPGDPIPSSLLDELQDQSIGGFNGPVVCPVAGVAFAATGAATRSGLRWTLTNDATLTWAIERPVGTDITAVSVSIRVITAPSVSGSMDIVETSFGDGGVTANSKAAMALPAVGAFQSYSLTLTPSPFRITAGFMYWFTLNVTGACNVLFEGLRYTARKVA